MATPINNSVPKVKGLIVPPGTKQWGSFDPSTGNIAGAMQQKTVSSGIAGKGDITVTTPYPKLKNSVTQSGGINSGSQLSNQQGSDTQAPTNSGSTYNGPTTDYSLTNTQNNQNTPPVDPVGSNTYSGGVNSYGQTLPGFTPQPQPQSLYGGLVSRVAEQSAKPSDQFTNAQEAALGYQGDLKRIREERAQGVFNTQNAGTPLSQALGQAGAINNLYAAREGAAASAFQGASSLLPSATAQQQAQISGTLGAAGLAAPTQVPYSNQYIDPTTGQPVGVSSGSGGIGGSLQNAVSSVVQKLSAGQMTYNDALNALSGYGQGGVNALQQALPPGFNIAQSNALAGQQGTIGANYDLAEAAISNLENAVKNLGVAQGTNVPGLNAVGNFLSNTTGIGAQQTREYTQAVQSARNAYAALIASVKGGIPTDYSSQALAEIPENPTPNDIAALRHSFEVLGKARKDIFGGAQNNQSGGSSGGVINTPYGAINPNL